MSESTDPTDVRAALEAAVAHRSANRFEEAARIVADLLDRIVSPQFPELWWLYGESLARLGRLGEAAAAFSKSAELGPGRWLTWKSLGEVYAVLDRPEESRKALLRATHLHKSDAELWSKLGVIE